MTPRTSVEYASERYDRASVSFSAEVQPAALERQTHENELNVLPVEIRLVLECARTQLTQAGKSTLASQLEHDLDWLMVRHVARLHHVGPLVYRNLYELGSERIPPRVIAELGRDYVQTTARNLYITTEMFAIMDLLEASDVPVLSFKGPGLAVAAYDDLTLRPFFDIDLRVAKEDLVAATAVLEERGYVRTHATDPTDPKDKDYSYYHEHYGVYVELHWRLSVFFPLDGLVGRALVEPKTIDVLERELPSLPVDVYLVALCAHGAHHRWNRLKWICDVAELLRRNPHLDGAKLLDTARSVGCGRAVQLGIHLAVWLLEAKMPRGMRIEPQVIRIAKTVPEVLFVHPQSDPSLRELLDFHGRLQDGWRARLRVVAYLWYASTAPVTHGGHVTWKGQIARSTLGILRPASRGLMRWLGRD